MFARHCATGRRGTPAAALLCLLALPAPALQPPSPASPGAAAPAGTTITRANWLVPPFNRWSLQHVPELLPTVAVPRGVGPVSPLPPSGRPLGELRFEPAPGQTATLAQWLAESYTDGFIVLHEGRVVHETYLNGFGPAVPHLTFSISKSIVGILAGVLADEGALALAHAVERYVPELGTSGFAGYTVRDLLDMRAAIDWREDYGDPRGPWRRWKDAIGWTLSADGATEAAVVGNYRFLPTLQRDPAGGSAFRYVSPTAEAAGWALERAGGQPLARLLAERLWAPLGAEQDAYFTTDPSSAVSAAGGFGATLRDLARVGQLVLDEGEIDGRRLVSRSWIRDISRHGSNAAWRNGQYRGYWNPDGAYRSFWYVTGDAHGSIEAIGIHGQRLHVDPARRLVVVRLASHPQASSRADYEACSRAIAAIALTR